MLHTRLAVLDAILERHHPALGKDYGSYRNHVYRVVNFCAAFPAVDPESLEKVAIAAAFHDLGIWTARTFDYLSPSEALARTYLAERGKTDWGPEVGAMIHEHHKVTPYRSGPPGLVESFRRADWVDVSRGVLTFGLSRGFLREVFAAFPNEGFHKLLLRLSLKRLSTHPWNPLPMFRL